ncbi:MAG: HPr family phosphocarrier protein [Porticoccaceae bacterium]|nr:HPr family phosphocarrier protein [Porticoccaceae bacterium]MDG1475136.1 HPr family phosphocarrier protein [Porticoccaceae bacterium]
MINTNITVINKLGLHARAATKLAKLANSYPCTIHAGQVEPLVDAKSVMSLMLLAACQGTELNFIFDGPEEAAAHRAVVELFENYFDEGE